MKLPEEQQCIIDRCYHPSGVFEEFRKEEVEQSIPDRFEKIVCKYPDRLAVKTGTQELTYRELNERANKVAGTIMARNTDRTLPIGILLDHGVFPIVAMIGVLKAGRFFLPLDLQYPPSMLAVMLDDSNPGLLIREADIPRTLEDLVDRGGWACVNMDDVAATTECNNLSLGISPRSLAWLSYTSGSTGKPKGVMQTHRNQLHYARVRSNSWHVSPKDKVCCPYSFAFSAAIWTVFDSLLNGAALLPFNLRAEGANHLANWIVKERVTISPFASSMFRHFVARLDDDWYPSDLRFLKVGAERLGVTEVALYKNRFPADCILATGLGSTETGPVRFYFMDHLSDIPENEVPVGYVIEGNEILLLDDNNIEVKPDQIGQIAVKSRFLSLGYWGRPDLTEERFRTGSEGEEERIYLTGDLGLMKPDGCLYHKGRKDFQVKVRGHKVELAQVEVALTSVPGVKEGAVTAKQDKSGGTRLVGYYVPAKHISLNVSHMRHFLEAKLPSYMVPSTFVELDALPQTQSGKIDHGALPEPSSQRPDLASEYAAPRTPIEQVLVRMWSEVLNVEQVGIYDEFMDLGGNSLLAAQVISRVIQEFQVELPARSLMDAPTVADMALLITQNRAQEASPAELERMLQELEDLSEEGAA